MRRLKRLATAALCLMIILSGCARGEGSSLSQAAQMPPPPAEVKAEVEVEEASALPVLRCLYEEQGLFLSAVAEPPVYELDGRVEAGMIPHHLLASDMIAGFFSLASSGGYERVLIIAPSHFPKLCGSDVVTGAAGWQTPYGLLQGDRDIPAALLADSLLAAQDSPEALERDHGVAGLMSFVKYYLPEARVAAVLLSGRLRAEKLEQVIEILGRESADGKTLLLASVDCSHYQQIEQAQKRDEETIEAIEDFDYGRIVRFKDQNIDSPQSLTVFLRLAQARGLDLTRLDHSSSAEKLPKGMLHNIRSEGVTTYLVYAASVI